MIPQDDHVPHSLSISYDKLTQSMYVLPMLECDTSPSIAAKQMKLHKQKKRKPLCIDYEVTFNMSIQNACSISGVHFLLFNIKFLVLCSLYHRVSETRQINFFLFFFVF